MEMRRIGVLVAVIGLALPAAAGARIVVNGGMFGVHLGATKNQVRHVLGPPSQAFGGGSGTTWFYATQNLFVGWLLNSKHVTMLLTTNTKQRTSAGVGVGSTTREVLRRVRGARCTTTKPLTPGADCSVTSRDSDRTTFFSITGGKVDSVMLTQQYP
jgi:hypothetical protein